MSENVKKTIVDRSPANGLRQETLTQMEFKPLVVSPPPEKNQKNKTDAETAGEETMTMTMGMTQVDLLVEDDDDDSDEAKDINDTTVKVDKKGSIIKLPKAEKEFHKKKYDKSMKAIFSTLFNGAYTKHLEDPAYVKLANTELAHMIDDWRLHVFKKLMHFQNNVLPLTKEQVNQKRFANHELLKARQLILSPNLVGFPFAMLNFKALHNLLGHMVGRETLFFVKNIARCRRYELDFEEISVRTGHIVITRFDNSWKGFVFGTRPKENGRYETIRADSILVHTNVCESDCDSDFHLETDDVEEKVYMA